LRNSVTQLVNKFSDGSLPCSQEPATGSYPDPVHTFPPYFPKIRDHMHVLFDHPSYLPSPWKLIYPKVSCTDLKPLVKYYSPSATLSLLDPDIFREPE